DSVVARWPGHVLDSGISTQALAAAAARPDAAHERVAAMTMTPTDLDEVAALRAQLDDMRGADAADRWYLKNLEAANLDYAQRIKRIEQIAQRMVDAADTHSKERH